ncbi:hypothetical protein [Pseudomonas sp. KBW05]|uniref:hypothetical protein n=1 Tax=Pseudomonas sp. KBW05 TaxID=2153360 RepID=UPI000F594D77|nr:hypothetical protein [Pseudomonas sp. KBW05]
MVFSAATSRSVAFSKIGEFFGGGINRGGTPSAPRDVSAPSSRGGSGSSSSSGSSSPKSPESFDQKYVDSQVHPAGGSGHTTGTKQPGDSTDVDTAGNPDLKKYQKEQQKKWQATKDAEARDKLFGQPTPGRVDGKEVESFSSGTLSDEAASLTSSAKARAEKAAPARNTSLLRTAAIALPFSALGLIVAGTANTLLKPLLDPSASSGLTKEELKEYQIVEQSQKDVFAASNAMNALKGDAPVEPGLNWVLKSNDERMDTLEDMMKIIETGMKAEAEKLNIPFTLASTGAVGDDIESRAKAINSRLAVMTALFSSVRARLDATA